VSALIWWPAEPAFLQHLFPIVSCKVIRLGLLISRSFLIDTIRSSVYCVRNVSRILSLLRIFVLLRQISYRRICARPALIETDAKWESYLERQKAGNSMRCQKDQPGQF
jgi:hypothetical protein